MKIYINDSKENWICDRLRKEFIDFNPQIITDNILEADIIWLYSNWIWQQIPTQILSSKKVITTIHHITPSKLNLKDFLYRDQFIDKYHVTCKKTIENFPKEIDRNKIFYVPYWYNKDLWYEYSISDKNKFKEQLKLPKNKFIIGSFQRDTEGSDLISPKLCKGPDIFCDIVENLDFKPHILLTGLRRQYVISRLKKAGISYTYYEMVNFRDLNRLYNCLDLYLVTSRFEGGPQSVLECSSNKTNILSTNVGIADIVLSPECILNTKEEFIEKINTKSFNTKEDNSNNIKQYSMDIIIPQYIDHIVKCL